MLNVAVMSCTARRHKKLLSESDENVRNENAGTGNKFSRRANLERN